MSSATEYLLIVIFVITLTYYSKAEETAETKLYPVDDTKFHTYKEKACSTIPHIIGAGDAINSLSTEITEEEVYEFALLNLAYGLTTDATAHLPMSLGWKKELVDYMADITLRTCASSALSSRFINGVKNLFLYYLYKVSFFPFEGNRSTIPEVDTNVWEQIIATVYTCGVHLGPIATIDVCGRFESFVDPSGATLPMKIVMEQVDAEVAETPGNGFDMIIDSVWWMFSLTYARCYRFYYPNEDIILRFYAHFRDDFLQGLHARWRGGGDNIDWFSIILGPVDVEDEWSNLRKCATTAYEYEGLGGRQLVRPLMVTVQNQIMKNFKVHI